MRRLLAGLLVATLTTTVTADPKQATPVPKGFALYPGARQLCQQHVNGGGGMHITWSSHATKDPLARVVAHYEQALGAKATAGDHGAKSIKLGDRHVTIYPATSNDKLPSCETKPAAGEQTIVMLSTAAR